jgi:hypothetical protein
LRYRISGAPTGSSVELPERIPLDEIGFELAVLGDRDADVGRLIEAVMGEPRREISHVEPLHSWWGRLFVTAHGLAGVAQDNLGTALLLGAGALALVPLALAVVYARLLLALVL